MENKKDREDNMSYNNDFHDEWAKDIAGQEKEKMNYERKCEENRQHDLLIRPDFSDYCKRIRLPLKIRHLFGKAYEIRERMGLRPWTHIYDSPLRYKIWKARYSFICQGRFSADSRNIIFVPADQGIKVEQNDHTTVICLSPKALEKITFLPAYPNTVGPRRKELFLKEIREEEEKRRKDDYEHEIKRLGRKKTRTNFNLGF